MSKIAVIFPGIGYHTDKPLLYYSTKMASAEGYDIIKIKYPEYPINLKGASEKQLKDFVILGLESTKDALKDVDFSIQDDILFVSKSIGTVIAAAYARIIDTGITGAEDLITDGFTPKGSTAGSIGRIIRHVLYTPLEQTFEYVVNGSGIAFNGTADNWADCGIIRELSRKADIPITTIEGGNHSLETGNVTLDIDNLRNVMSETKAYVLDAKV